MRYWMGVLGGLVSGAALGSLATYAALEIKKKQEVDEQVALQHAVYTKALDLIKENQEIKDRENGEILTQIEAEVEQMTIPEIDIAVQDHLQKFVETHPDRPAVPAQRENAYENQNDYHKAVAAKETPVEQFVDGGVNDYGVSYIEEEDYLDEDGRFKGKIDIMMDGMNPVFIMDGQQIDDWDRRLGDSILVDFYRLVPPGVERILYVRNHRTDEDYEVVQVLP